MERIDWNVPVQSLSIQSPAHCSQGWRAQQTRKLETFLPAVQFAYPRLSVKRAVCRLFLARQNPYVHRSTDPDAEPGGLRRRHVGFLWL